MHYIQDASIDCPWCGEVFPTSIDTSQGPHEHIEDCAVCCRPIAVSVECEPGEIHSLESTRP
ncbi:MAG: CPXCG motif-containing cysteine-rich protein [Chthoniobacteraceae bacterium]|nr:CPXCG motif-containing cysteine-rich protein [Chthoniobacteraceae bacterium]